MGAAIASRTINEDNHPVASMQVKAGDMRSLLITSVAVSLLAVAACGGGTDGPEIMPAVESKRLDVAQSDLEKLGVSEDDVEIIGGGALGVVDESNWVVCDQEPGPGEPLDGAIRLTVDRACDGGDQMSTSDENTETPSPDPSASEESNDAVEVETFKMPRLVGENLQDAQDRLQSLGSYVLRQDDARGLNRFKVLDSNWMVCDQRPRPGRSVPIDKQVILDAVKLSEPCP